MNDRKNPWFAEGFIPAADEDWEMIHSAALSIFRPTAPIDETRLFAGRIEQIQNLLDVIYQAGAHAIVYGERGVGKSSLVNIIRDRILGPSKSNEVLKISCSPNDTFSTVWGNVFFDSTYDGRKVGSIIADQPQPFTIFKIAEALPKEKKHLIVLDEFDRIRDENTKTLIADTIKYLSDNPVSVTIVVVGVGKSIHSLFGSHPSIQRCCVQVPMPRMSRDELRQVIEDRLPSIEMTIDTDVLDQMAQFSQGLPGYMHLLGLHAVRSAVSNRTQHIDARHLDDSVNSALEKADESTRADYYKAIQSTKPENRYKEVLLACALASKNERGQFSASDVIEPYSQIIGRQMGIEGFARHLNAFCESDRGPALVKEGKPKRYLYHFDNPLLEPLVIMKGKKPA